MTNWKVGWIEECLKKLDTKLDKISWIKKDEMDSWLKSWLKIGERKEIEFSVNVQMKRTKGLFQFAPFWC